MFEKVNPQHPDKVADRIAGAIVDLAYAKSENPKVAAEVLLGHGQCSLQIETSERLTQEELEAIVHRIAGEEVEVRALIVPQDVHLADNQAGAVRCGDNGIFRGCAPTHEQKLLTAIATSIYDRYPTDGKYIIGKYMPNLKKAIGERGRDQIVPSDEDTRSFAVTICQSNATYDEILKTFHDFFEGNGGGKVSPHVSTLKDKDGLTRYYSALINPLGPWTGGTDVDCGATNRKLGSDTGASPEHLRVGIGRTEAKYTGSISNGASLFIEHELTRMEARCFECGTTLVHSDTYMAEDVLTVEGYEGDDKALMQCYYCPHCGREYNVFDPTQDKRETTYNEYWSKH